MNQIASTEAGKVVWELRSTQAITSWGTSYGFNRRILEMYSRKLITSGMFAV